MSEPPKPFADKDTAERAEAALKRMLQTPPKPHKDSKLGRKKRESTQCDVAGLDNVVDAGDDAVAPVSGWQVSFAAH